MVSLHKLWTTETGQPANRPTGQTGQPANMAELGRSLPQGKIIGHIQKAPTDIERDHAKPAPSQR